MAICEVVGRNAGEKQTPALLRWAGGKQYLVDSLVSYLPADVRSRTYREPFLGAGSMFFRLSPERAILSDANEFLIRTYERLRDSWGLLHRYLQEHKRKTCEQHYYRTRDTFNTSTFSAAQAARFIYLNKTCFNGIFRVNTKGEFNVPYGWKEPPAIPDAAALTTASKILKNATLLSCDYEVALKNASKGDFIYLDPPYPPLNGTAYFTHYTKERFTAEDQAQLAAWVRRLHERGCLILMTNADIKAIRRLYQGFNLMSVPVTRFVTCKAIRHSVKELVITNY